VNTTTEGTYIAVSTYTNECNVQSRLTYKVIVCDSTVIEPWYQINGGNAIQSASIQLRIGTPLLLSPHPVDGQGIWSWTGAGTSGTLREQTPNTSIIGVFEATVTYTNGCGAKSRLKMNIRVCDSTKIMSYFMINNTYWQESDSIRVNSGDILTLGPYPPVGSGVWSWTGAGLSGNSREQNVNTSIAGKYTAMVTYTNTCGIESHLFIKITVDPVNQNKELKTITETIRIYPNPSPNGTFTITGLEKNMRIELLNLVGEKLAEFNSLNKTSIDITVKPTPEIYVLKFSNKQQSVYKKIVVE
jgi:hypothetical protein